MPLASRHFTEKCTECDYRTLRLFCDLNVDALQRLDEIGMHVALPGRAVLFNEHQRPNGVFVVCEGRLKLSATSREGRVMILRLAAPGDVLGLSAVLNNVPHEVTAETLEPTILKNIPSADFVEFMHTYAEVGEKTSRVLAKEYRDVFLDARRLALSGSASGRLAQLLLEWANTASCGKPELRFTMALTHEELASMAGTSRETVTRLLNQFERDHLITRHGSTFSILNPSSLSQLAQ